jgi:uncharacterized protein HemY
MIRFFLYSLLAVVLGLLVTVALARDPGYLLLSWGNVTFETSLFALFVALILLLLALRVLYLLSGWLNPLRWLRSGRQRSAARAARRALNARHDSMEEQAELIHRLESLAAESGTTPAAVRRFWKRHTRGLAPDDDLVSAAAHAYLQLGAPAEAVDLLEATLKSRWSDVLVRRYSLLSLKQDDASAVQQLQQAERWLSQRPEDAVLLLATARLALRASLWGKARDYLERCVRLNGDAEAYAELARLLQNLREDERDPRLLQAATRAVSAALPPFPQPQ